jgi:hypothetical protein
MKKWNESDLKLALQVKSGELKPNEAERILDVDSCQLNNVLSAFKALEKDSNTKRASKLMKKVWDNFKSKSKH